MKKMFDCKRYTRIKEENKYIYRDQYNNNAKYFDFYRDKENDILFKITWDNILYHLVWDKDDIIDVWTFDYNFDDNDAVRYVNEYADIYRKKDENGDELIEMLNIEYFEITPDKQYLYEENYLRKDINNIISVFKNYDNEKILKVVRDGKEFIKLIRKMHEKIEIWMFYDDFNYGSATLFLKYFDEDVRSKKLVDMESDELKELKCENYIVIEDDEENKNDFRKEYLKENERIEWFNIKNEYDENINKVVRDKEMFILIRDSKDKMEVWIMCSDFNIKSALSFIKEWDDCSSSCNDGKLLKG